MRKGTTGGPRSNPQPPSLAGDQLLQTIAQPFCLGNGQVHAKGTHVQAHAHVPIDQSCGFCFLDDVDRSIRLQNAVLDAVQVNGLEPPDAVAVDPSLVCFDQDIGRDLGLLFWTPGPWWLLLTPLRKVQLFWGG